MTNQNSKMESKELHEWLLILVSWVFAAYFFILFHKNLDWNDLPNNPDIRYMFLVFGILLALLPFLKRLKVGNLFELERDIKDTKNDLNEFKGEVRQMLSIVSTNINTIGNLTNTITINLPGTAEASEAREKLAESSDPETLQASEEIKDELSLEGDDTIMALARTRIRLEYLLRHILGQGTRIGKMQRDIKFMSMGQLYRLFLKENPDYINLESSFAYVGKICNAAIHAQRVSEGQAREALDIGARLIAILNKISEKQKSANPT